MLIYLALATAGHALQDNPLPAVLPAVQGLLLLCATVYLLLWWFSMPGRLPQTLFSLLASASLLGLLGLLLQAAMPANAQAANPLLVSVWLLLFAWSFVVDAHIFRHALDVSFSIGMLIAVLLFAAHQTLLAAWYVSTTAVVSA